MALPSGMKVVNVQIGPVTDFSGQVLATKVVLTPPIPMRWLGTGSPMFNKPIPVTLDDDGLGLVALPATDQDGFVDGRGKPVKNWTYEVRWIFDDRTVPKIDPYNIALTSDQDTVNLGLVVTTVPASTGGSGGEGPMDLIQTYEDGEYS